mmetsp:Transcript_34254/g.95585  ORF Transcript_34254/g.95585 Transcript_34254/m.95585 type:complete len:227 (-) Transcript_34254:441-1121(-)
MGVQHTGHCGSRSFSAASSSTRRSSGAPNTTQQGPSGSRRTASGSGGHRGTGARSGAGQRSAAAAAAAATGNGSPAASTTHGLSIFAATRSSFGSATKSPSSSMDSTDHATSVAVMPSLGSGGGGRRRRRWPQRLKTIQSMHRGRVLRDGAPPLPSSGPSRLATMYSYVVKPCDMRNKCSTTSCMSSTNNGTFTTPKNAKRTRNTSPGASLTQPASRNRCSNDSRS